MPRYFKLGVSKNSDRDTYLFQGPDPIPKQCNLDKDEFQIDAQEDTSSCKWAPPPSFLRRAQSSRERPVVAPPPQDKLHHKNSKFHPKQINFVEEKQDEAAAAAAPPPVALLRRAISSREQRKDLWARIPVAAAADDKLGPLEEAVQRGFGMVKPQQVPGGHGGFLDHVKQTQQQQQLPRAQSMRYNRIQEDANLSGYGGPPAVVPPRHSSFTGDDDGYFPDSMVAAPAKKQKLVVVSAAFQTGEGEILSIECAKCGRWLGTVAQRVSLDEGMLKLCQICHPPEEDDPKLLVPPFPSAYYDGQLVEGSPAAKLRKGNGFVRGLRRFLGLKKKPLYSFTAAEN